MARLAVTDSISIDDSEIEESFVLASGPGGQNVNKLSTAVQLRFDALHSPSIADETRLRLMRLAGSRLTKDGVIVIVAREHRMQNRNREAARERLFDLIRRAAVRIKPRRATKPTRASKERRLQAKSKHGQLKRTRGHVRDE